MLPVRVAREDVVSQTLSGDVITTTETTVTMSAKHCGSCPLLKLCPIKRQGDRQEISPRRTDNPVRHSPRRRTGLSVLRRVSFLLPIAQRVGSYQLKFTDKARRLAARRREESTDMFAERYAPRADIESTNSGLKNRFVRDSVPVCGKGPVYRVMLNKVTGWNILRAASTAKLRLGVGGGGKTARSWLVGELWADLPRD